MSKTSLDNIMTRLNGLDTVIDSVSVDTAWWSLLYNNTFHYWLLYVRNNR